MMMGLGPDGSIVAREYHSIRELASWGRMNLYLKWGLYAAFTGNARKAPELWRRFQNAAERQTYGETPQKIYEGVLAKSVLLINLWITDLHNNTFGFGKR